MKESENKWPMIAKIITKRRKNEWTLCAGFIVTIKTILYYDDSLCCKFNLIHCRNC